MRAAADSPQRVRRLVPVATSSRVGRLAARWYEERAQLADQGAEALHPVLERDTRQQFANEGGEFAHHSAIRRESTADPRDFLCPPRAGEIIASGIPGARLEVLPASGHQVPVERPAELSRSILSFLDREIAG